MVLKTNTLPAATNPAASTANTRPAFEPMDDDTVGTVGTETPAANAAQAEPATLAGDNYKTPAPAAPAVRPAVQVDLPAIRAHGAVVASTTAAGDKFKAEVEAMKGAIDFAYGNYPMFKASNGKIKCKEPVASLGAWVRGTMIGWNDRVQISPGEGKSKDWVAYADDCVTISKVIGEGGADWEGRPVSEYLTHLRADQGCTLAKASTYVDVAFAVAECEASNTEFIGEVIQITLSQSSIPSFKSYQEKLKATAVCVAKGLPGFKLPEDPFHFYFQVEDVSKGDNEWSKLKVLSKLPTKA